MGEWLQDAFPTQFCFWTCQIPLYLEKNFRPVNSRAGGFAWNTPKWWFRICISSLRQWPFQAPNDSLEVHPTRLGLFSGPQFLWLWFTVALFKTGPQIFPWNSAKMVTASLSGGYAQVVITSPRGSWDDTGLRWAQKGPFRICFKSYCTSWFMSFYFYIPWPVCNCKLVDFISFLISPWRIHGAAKYLYKYGVPWIPSTKTRLMLALIYQHQPDPSWVYKLINSS